MTEQRCGRSAKNFAEILQVREEWLSIPKKTLINHKVSIKVPSEFFLLCCYVVSKPSPQSSGIAMVIWWPDDFAAGEKVLAGPN
jgi:hypothetical protein